MAILSLVFTVGFKIKNSIIKITNAIDIWNESVNQLRLFLIKKIEWPYQIIGHMRMLYKIKDM
ncbi:hypothetical protein [Staphylococcus aureus]|uniref:hypothetical protein n=1 Tax=Staphylococcus aureus TaxID=1280 RepID=UPI0019D3240D|nr:hypothetical protein [Staphylococcus aureus]